MECLLSETVEPSQTDEVSVLILILMECLLSQTCFGKSASFSVLILILMECLLRCIPNKYLTELQSCLNPYSNGMLT